MKNYHIEYLKNELNVTDEKTLSYIDEQIRLYIDNCRYKNEQLELRTKLNTIITKSFTSPNKKKRKATIQHIEEYYLRNYLQLDIQDLLFSVLSLFASVLIMISTTIDLSVNWNYFPFINSGILLVSLLIWLIMDIKLRNHPNGNLKELLDIINYLGNIWIFVLNLLFYFVYSICYYLIYVKGDTRKIWHALPVIIILLCIVIYICGCRNEYYKKTIIKKFNV